jgi:hypothetical protein
MDGGGTGIRGFHIDHGAAAAHGTLTPEMCQTFCQSASNCGGFTFEDKSGNGSMVGDCYPKGTDMIITALHRSLREDQFSTYQKCQTLPSSPDGTTPATTTPATTTPATTTCENPSVEYECELDSNDITYTGKKIPKLELTQPFTGLRCTVQTEPYGSIQFDRTNQNNTDWTTTTKVKDLSMCPRPVDCLYTKSIATDCSTNQIYNLNGRRNPQEKLDVSNFSPATNGGLCSSLGPEVDGMHNLYQYTHIKVPDVPNDSSEVCVDFADMQNDSDGGVRTLTNWTPSRNGCDKQSLEKCTRSTLGLCYDATGLVRDASKGFNAHKVIGGSIPLGNGEITWNNFDRCPQSGTASMQNCSYDVNDGICEPGTTGVKRHLITNFVPATRDGSMISQPMSCSKVDQHVTTGDTTLSDGVPSRNGIFYAKDTSCGVMPHNLDSFTKVSHFNKKNNVRLQSSTTRRPSTSISTAKFSMIEAANPNFDLSTFGNENGRVPQYLSSDTVTGSTVEECAILCEENDKCNGFDTTTVLRGQPVEGTGQWRVINDVACNFAFEDDTGENTISDPAYTTYTIGADRQSGTNDETKSTPCHLQLVAIPSNKSDATLRDYTKSYDVRWGKELSEVSQQSNPDPMWASRSQLAGETPYWTSDHYYKITSEDGSRCNVHWIDGKGALVGSSSTLADFNDDRIGKNTNIKNLVFRWEPNPSPTFPTSSTSPSVPQSQQKCALVFYDNYNTVVDRLDYSSVVNKERPSDATKYTLRGNDSDNDPNTCRVYSRPYVRDLENYLSSTTSEPVNLPNHMLNFTTDVDVCYPVSPTITLDDAPTFDWRCARGVQQPIGQKVCQLASFNHYRDTYTSAGKRCV